MLSTRNIKEALNLIGVQIDRQYAVDTANAAEHVRHDLGGVMANTRARARRRSWRAIAEVGHHGR